MRGLFICKTPYQVMTATRIVLERFPADTVDVVLFDTIANVDALYEGVATAGVFHRVSVFRCGSYYSLPDFKRRLCPLFLRTKPFDREPYDFVFFSNILDWLVNNMVRQLRKGNRDLRVYMYEDGFASYAEHFRDFFRMLAQAKGARGWYYRTIYNEYYKIKGFFVFSPELMDWKPPFPVEAIAKIGQEDRPYREAINQIFGYDRMTDVYDADVIFFEESYFADGMDIGDTEVVGRLSQTIGKEALFVKIHPRNPVNRFRQLGFSTNTNTEIPWEVIALNLDLSDKVLITIASGSALTSLVNMESRPKKIIMLMDCKEIDSAKLTPTLPTLRKIAYSHKEEVLTPHSFEELMHYFGSQNQRS